MGEDERFGIQPCKDLSLRGNMREFFEKAVENVIQFGDTDIFPFPIENLIFFDKKKDVVDLLLDIDAKFEEFIAEYPPVKYDSIVPVGYTGFRWASQIDPLWNVYLLGLVLSLSERIEQSRVGTERNVVFSYRLANPSLNSELFQERWNWRCFMEESIRRAGQSKFVVVCDISEFYGRLNHHRLENALKHLHHPGNQVKKIVDILSVFSGTYSVGIPVGGPASRILAELCLDQIDHLLLLNGVDYCRYADDFHIFCDSQEDAYGKLIFMSENFYRIKCCNSRNRRPESWRRESLSRHLPFRVR